MEIVTWVLEGSLVHQDSTGHNGIIYPGLAQRMSAGRGILHSEKNDSWRLEGETAPRPGALRADVGGARRGRHHARLRAARDRRRAAHAAAWSRSPPAWTSTTARRPSGSRTGTPRCTPPGSSPASPSSCPRRRSCTCSCPAARSTLEGAGPLATGDAVRFTATGGQQVTATEPAEILVWEMHATLPADPTRSRAGPEQVRGWEHDMTERDLTAIEAERERIRDAVPAAAGDAPGLDGPRPAPHGADQQRRGADRALLPGPAGVPADRADREPRLRRLLALLLRHRQRQPAGVLRLPGPRRRPVRRGARRAAPPGDLGGPRALAAAGRQARRTPASSTRCTAGCRSTSATPTARASS